MKKIFEIFFICYLNFIYLFKIIHSLFLSNFKYINIQINKFSFILFQRVFTQTNNTNYIFCLIIKQFNNLLAFQN